MLRPPLLVTCLGTVNNKNQSEPEMKAILFEAFGGPIRVDQVPAPVAPDHGVVVQVALTGLCRSDWHGWMGHDPGISLPHVPGHEFAGHVSSVGSAVTRFTVGDRVTVPFVGGCGQCAPCHTGNQQVCDAQSQPGFTHWGSFAEYVRVDRADLNVVHLPDSVSFEAAAGLGCRFATAFRALVDQGRISAGQFVAIFGCGGVGLSAVAIAASAGARVIAVDLSDDALALACELGAEQGINAGVTAAVPAAVRALSHGGVAVGIDALGHTNTCVQSVLSLAKRGKHIQVGLMAGEHARAPLPMDVIVANELEVLGSHGIQAHRYDAMLGLLISGQVKPDTLVRRVVGLDQGAELLASMDSNPLPGVTLIQPSLGRHVDTSG